MCACAESFGARTNKHQGGRTGSSYALPLFVISYPALALRAPSCKRQTTATPRTRLCVFYIPSACVPGRFRRDDAYSSLGFSADNGTGLDAPVIDVFDAVARFKPRPRIKGDSSIREGKTRFSFTSLSIMKSTLTITAPRLTAARHQRRKLLEAFHIPLHYRRL